MLNLLFFFTSMVTSYSYCMYTYKLIFSERKRTVSRIFDAVFALCMGTTSNIIGRFLDKTSVHIVMIILCTLLMTFVLHESLKYTFLCSIICFSIIFALQGLSLPISFIIDKLVFNEFNEYRAYLISIVLYAVSDYLVYKSKLLKHKIPKQLVNQLYIVIICIGVMFLSLLVFAIYLRDKAINQFYWSVIPLILINLACIIVTVNTIVVIRIYYKKIKKLETDRKNLDTTNQSLKNTNEKLISEIHDTRDVYDAIKIATDYSMRRQDVEFSAELTEELQRLQKEYDDELRYAIRKNTVLPSTGMMVIDSLLNLYLEETIEKGIHFQVLQGNPLYLVVQEKLITQIRLQILLKDHIRNAITALEKSNSYNKYLWLCLGINENGFYEINFRDNGVPFRTETLLRLGNADNTTDGSGKGFLKTLETAERFRASLIIEEGPDFKSINMIFDGQHRLQILSHRAGELTRGPGQNSLFQIILV